MMSKPAGCRNLKRRILTEGVIVVLAALVWILGAFANLPVVGATAAQKSSEVYRRVYNGWKWVACVLRQMSRRKCAWHSPGAELDRSQQKANG